MPWTPQGEPSVYVHAPAFPVQTPSETERSSRSKGLDNLVHYASAIRQGDEELKDDMFRVGDAVTVSYDACVKHLVTSPLLVWSQKHEAMVPSRRKKGTKQETEDRRNLIDDKIQDGIMMGFIADIFEDAGKKLRVRIQWLYRPKIALATWKIGVMENMGIHVQNVSAAAPAVGVQD